MTLLELTITFAVTTLLHRAWRRVNQYIIDRKGYKWFYRNVYTWMPNWRFARWVKFFWNGRKCNVCGARWRLDVHHKSYEHKWLEWLFPWELEVLCRKHHQQMNQ